MAKRRTTPKELPDAVREAVERTVQATAGSADRTRNRAQGAVDDLLDTVRGAIDERMPATHDDVRDIRSQLRAIARRLDSIEERLPAPRSSGSRSRGRSPSKRSS